jgi:hypothetical protein
MLVELAARARCAVERPHAQDAMMGPTCGQDAAVEPAAMVE